MALREASPRIVPTMEHARAAAEVLQAEGASTVLLFGSLAAGVAREGSDIDLVSVFDDIDYEERYPLRWRLEAQCTAAAGVPVGVHVTDWPEWKRRVECVSSSFEAHIAQHQQALFEREPDPDAVRWGKKIGMAGSNLEEGMDRLVAVRQSLGSMAVHCQPRDDETTVAGEQLEIDGPVREERMRDLCANASVSIENSLKAWGALNGVRSMRTHSVATLLQHAQPVSDPMSESLSVLRANTMRPEQEEFDDISSWRIGGTYPTALPQATTDKMERLAYLLTHAAVTSAAEVVTRALDDGADPADPRIVHCQQRIQSARAALAARDIVTGVVADAPPE